MTIKILVLKSGEDVIADIKEMMTSDKQVMGYILTKPCVVKLISSAPLTAEDDCHINQFSITSGLVFQLS